MLDEDGWMLSDELDATEDERRLTALWALAGLCWIGALAGLVLLGSIVLRGL